MSHKHPVQPKHCSGAMYSNPCKDCNHYYIGETERIFQVRCEMRKSDACGMIIILIKTC